MLEYASRDLAIQKMRAGNASADDIRAKARALHQFASDHDGDGVFLVRNNRLALPRLLGHYGINAKDE